jgi:hypothetical protein
VIAGTQPGRIAAGLEEQADRRLPVCQTGGRAELGGEEKAAGNERHGRRAANDLAGVGGRHEPDSLAGAHLDRGDVTSREDAADGDGMRHDEDRPAVVLAGGDRGEEQGAEERGEEPGPDQGI